MKKRNRKKPMRSNKSSWLLKKLIEIGIALILSGFHISISFNIFIC